MIHAHDVEAELWRFVDDGDQPSPNDLWRCIQYTARKKATALLAHYHPIELDPALTIAEKLPIMQEWYRQGHSLLLLGDVDDIKVIA